MREETPSPLTKQPQEGSAPPQNIQTPFYRSKKAISGGIGFAVGLAFLTFLIGGISAAAIQFYITTLLSFLVLSVIAIQAEIYSRQAKLMHDGLTETRNLIKQADRHFNISQRPILVALDVDAPVNCDQFLKPKIKIANHGLGTATEINLWFAVTMNSSFQRNPNKSQIIYVDICTPQDEINALLLYTEEDWNFIDRDSFLQIVERQQQTLYVYGWGDYWDIEVEQRYNLDTWAFRWTAAEGWVKDAAIISLSKGIQEAAGRLGINTSGNDVG
ncbi:MAG: hypothetical protein IPL32_12460 [Chloracidobacterium sp.]|nr:hypothetical protein [Chloracidobacterium sp.]